MRALRLHGPGDLRLEEVPAPTGDATTAIVSVEACGVCGSDVHFIEGSARTGHIPITLGHEIAGTVVDAPPNTVEPGTSVVAEVGKFCAACPRCIEGRHNLCERASVLGINVDGGFADQVAVPLESLHERPGGISPIVAATAVDAGATALHAIRRRASVVPGESVLIIGIGGLGTYGLQFARDAGAGAVLAADTDPKALKRAAALGADETVLVEPGDSLGRRIKLLTDGGVDAAVEFVGAAATVDAAVKSIRPGGRAVVVGVGLDPLTTLPPVLWSNHEYTLTGSYGSLPGDAAEVLGLLATGAISPPSTRTVGLADAPDAIISLAAGKRSGGQRLIVTP